MAEKDLYLEQYWDEDFREAMSENLERKLMLCAIEDPLSNYAREQDHFIKYAPAYEVQAWKDWNKGKKETALNKFHSSKDRRWRMVGEMPMYIEKLLDLKEPGFWKIKKNRIKFYKRNPLFCIPEVI